MEKEAEAHAICLDVETDESSPGSGRSFATCVPLAGDKYAETINDLGFVSDASDVSEAVEGSNTSFDVYASDFFAARMSIKFLSFVQSNPSSPSVGKSTFSNIELYEDSNGPTASDIGSCPPNAQWVNSSCKCGRGYVVAVQQ